MRLQILAVCGSLRAQSSNRAVLQAFGCVLGARADGIAFAELAELPHFNPDLDGESVPPAVAAWRAAVDAADVLVISTPEYAHGLPGTFKNALDWLVAHPPFAGKKIAILFAERGSPWAYDSLREILRTMSADLIEGACVGLRLETNRLTAQDILGRVDLRAALAAAATAVVAARDSVN